MNVDLMSDFIICQAEGESSDDSDETNIDDLGLSVELSESEEETNKEKLKRWMKLDAVQWAGANSTSDHYIFTRITLLQY